MLATAEVAARRPADKSSEKVPADEVTGNPSVKAVIITVRGLGLGFMFLSFSLIRHLCVSAQSTPVKLARRAAVV
jgi:hypothetical protein